jgi:hypothetical protein
MMPLKVKWMLHCTKKMLAMVSNPTLVENLAKFSSHLMMFDFSILFAQDVFLFFSLANFKT